MSDDKNYIIDPLTCLCKFALLDLMSDGTKISISSHVLNIQKYNQWQWLERMTNRDTRFDIANLVPSVIKAIRWYLLDDDDNKEKFEMDSDLREAIVIIARHALSGLNKLKKTYKGDYNVIINLQYFGNLIRDALEDEWNENDVIDIETNPDSTLSDKIKQNFNQQNVTMIGKMLTDATKAESSRENTESLIDCIAKLVEGMDTNFTKLMKDLTTKL